MLKTTIIFLLLTTANFTQVENMTVTSFDSTPIIYQKSGIGEQAIVFVHCWSCDKSYWQSTIEYLSNTYTTIAIDLAGHGESGLERTEWTIENYAKDVKAVIENENLKNVILIGHSMGGPVILSAAQLIGDNIRALIAVDTFQDIEGRWTDEQFEVFFKPFEEDFPSTTKAFVKSIFGENADSNLVMMIANDMSSAPQKVALASFRSLFNFEEAPIFDETDIPVRFINSKRFPTNTINANKHIKDFELITIEDVGHFPMLENPEEFNRILEMTIKQLK
ncbi:MAG: alpha/beta hydrolase [Ignavibacteria bacterium]|nr:alpha/beta hydrolase [Ignavibacteria bacterium]MBT8382553.1 alpha/beta hydrolase [Ignavibacteria bacterium]NNJ53910.1 alpha/beta hydrolase [Ignavibacteriaceae bacterium]NNL19777.1 alpha/beta hydrolase [Ignavibacteriaceae bacterium]